MAYVTKSLVTLLLIFSLVSSIVNALPLSLTFYSKTCPPLGRIVCEEMTKAIAREPRLGASILRLFFHDCFVNGCDGSVLLDDSPTLKGEKNAPPNRNSLRGFEVIDTIKARLEAACNNTVSCADILAQASRDAVVLLGGPTWKVFLGRRDARTVNESKTTDLPPPSANLSTLISMFAAKGLDSRDLTALSGAHTIGLAHCINFKGHIYNDTNVDPNFAATLKKSCPISGGDSNLAPIDMRSPQIFGINYYQNLLDKRGLFHSDQVLFNNGSQDALVKIYSSNTVAFYNDFLAAMVKMGNIGVLTGTEGEIRKNCRMPNIK